MKFCSRRLQRVHQLADPWGSYRQVYTYAAGCHNRSQQRYRQSRSESADVQAAISTFDSQALGLSLIKSSASFASHDRPASKHWTNLSRTLLCKVKTCSSLSCDLCFQSSHTMTLISTRDWIMQRARLAMRHYAHTSAVHACTTTCKQHKQSDSVTCMW